MQQGLGRNASAQQAGPTQPWFRLDKRNIESLVSREERCRVATRSATENNERYVHLSGQEFDYDVDIYGQADVTRTRQTLHGRPQRFDIESNPV